MHLSLDIQRVGWARFRMGCAEDVGYHQSMSTYTIKAIVLRIVESVQTLQEFCSSLGIA
jgi:hypothetical protein